MYMPLTVKPIIFASRFKWPCGKNGSARATNLFRLLTRACMYVFAGHSLSRFLNKIAQNAVNCRERDPFLGNERRN